MTVTIAGIWIRIEPELLTDQINIRLLAGEEEPSWADVIFFRVRLQHRRGITLGINSDGVKENVLAHAVSQNFLGLDQPRCFQRAGVNAVGVNKIDSYSFSFQQVIIKMYDLAILGDERNIGKVISSPVRPAGLSNVAASNENGGSKDDCGHKGNAQQISARHPLTP